MCDHWTSRAAKRNSCRAHSQAECSSLPELQNGHASSLVRPVVGHLPGHVEHSGNVLMVSEHHGKGILYVPLVQGQHMVLPRQVNSLFWQMRHSSMLRGNGAQLLLKNPSLYGLQLRGGILPSNGTGCITSAPQWCMRLRLCKLRIGAQSATLHLPALWHAVHCLLAVPESSPFLLLAGCLSFCTLPLPKSISYHHISHSSSPHQDI